PPPPSAGQTPSLHDALPIFWTDDRVTMEGEYYSTVDASIYDRPETPIPVYIAAGGPLVARYAGRAGDGFICTSGKGMIDASTVRAEEHTSELQSRENLVCRL